MVIKVARLFTAAVFILLAILPAEEAVEAAIAPFQARAETRQQQVEEPCVFITYLDEGAVITGGNVGYVKRVLEQAEEQQAEAVIVKLNTPGGLLDATFELMEAFLNAEVPVVVYVSPHGAMATSAGAFILLSSDVAVMSPVSTVGAAEPVVMSPEGGEEPAGEKTVNVIVKRSQEQARERGRPPEVAERFVTENLKLGAEEALDKGVIEMISPSLEELLQDLDGYTIEKGGKEFTINSADAVLVEENMRSGERVQNWVSNPQVALLLMLAGMMLLYLGFSNPGTFVPEVLGGISLVMAVYGMGLFETSTAGILLLLLGVGLIIAEVFVAGFGILGVGGAASLLIGALLLPSQEELIGEDWYRSFAVIAVGAVIGFLLIVLVVVQRVISTRRYSKEAPDSIFNMPGKGEVVVELNPEGMVKARGENWRARSANGETIPEGAKVEVVGNEGLVLQVIPAEEAGREQ